MPRLAYEYKLIEQAHEIYITTTNEHGLRRGKSVAYVDYVSELSVDGWIVDEYDVDFASYKYTVMKRPLPDLQELAEQTKEILDGHAD